MWTILTAVCDCAKKVIPLIGFSLVKKRISNHSQKNWRIYRPRLPRISQNSWLNKIWCSRSNGDAHSDKRIINILINLIPIFFMEKGKEILLNTMDDLKGIFQSQNLLGDTHLWKYWLILFIDVSVELLRAWFHHKNCNT